MTFHQVYLDNKRKDRLRVKTVISWSKRDEAQIKKKNHEGKDYFLNPDIIGILFATGR